MECQVCGKPAALEALIEGARVPVCEKCVRFGRIVSRPVVPVKRQAPLKKAVEAPEKLLVQGFGALVMNAREAAGFSRDELAKKIFIREHELAKIEEEKLRPDERTARKLEFALGIKLYEDIGLEIEMMRKEKKRSGKDFTMADMVELREET